MTCYLTAVHQNVMLRQSSPLNLGHVTEGAVNNKTVGSLSDASMILMSALLNTSH